MKATAHATGGIHICCEIKASHPDWGFNPITNRHEFRSSTFWPEHASLLASRFHSRRMRSPHETSLLTIVRRTWKAVLADRLFGHAAELGFYFLFALFPTLFCAGSILGFMARSAHQISDKLLDYLALVIPTSALGAVLNTFNETTTAASSGKLTFGSIAAIWSASIGISAIQDTLNEVYKIDDSRSYVMARIYAIILTIVLTVLVALGLGSMLGGDFFAALADRVLANRLAAAIVGTGIRIVAWAAASCLLAFSFAVLYYWAPDWKERHWRWLTPGSSTGIVGWLLASLGFRVYIHYFNTYTVTYGSLGAVIILLMWFYITGLMLLLGAEIDTVLDGDYEEAHSEFPPPRSEPSTAK
jgi:membrane protein